MTVNKKMLLFLSLIVLACSLPNMALVEPFPTEQPSPSPSATMARAEITQAATPARSCTVTAESLHLREMPGTSAQVVDYLHSGDLLTLLSDPPRDSWIHVEAKKQEGWINSKYTNCEVHP